MADVEKVQQTDDWYDLPWKQFQWNVYRLQRRIYQATSRDDHRRVHQLQRLLLRSWSARCLAVKQVTQDNRGKRTAGVDGLANYTPPERLRLAEGLKHLDWPPTSGIRRTYIPKSNGSGERRPLGIPTMLDRARQALVKLALEPEWESRFEPNSYGFRPGRCTHDAIEAIYNYIRLKPKYVLDADIAACFDEISHPALLNKLRTIAPIGRLVREWLKAGILEGEVWHEPQAGVPQGGVLSPLLCNIALHGFEQAIVMAAPSRPRTALIRYADDLVILHPDLDVLQALQAKAEKWLAEIGLRLKPSKTRITHTLNKHEGKVGFDFLGFHIRQYRVGQHQTRSYRGQAGFKTIIKPSKPAIQRHLRKLKQVIRQYRGAPQVALIAKLNPIIRGWRRYFRTCSSKRTFARIDSLLHRKLMKWAHYRHRNKGHGWCYRRYWQQHRQRICFADGSVKLTHHQDEPIVRHVKVRSVKSPYDGDWVYWARRLGRHPTKPRRVTKLMKTQQGRCGHCGVYFMAEDVMEVHHRDGDHSNNRKENLVLLHGHCHDAVHRSAKGADDNSPD
jgi:RNA-directed DNA polymerase